MADRITTNLMTRLDFSPLRIWVACIRTRIDAGGLDLDDSDVP